MNAVMHHAHSAAFLDAGGAFRRQPRAPGRTRPQAFHDNYEALLLYYDCFRSGRDVLLVGPPPHGFEEAQKSARMVGMPGEIPLTARHHGSVSVMITQLTEVPAEIDTIRVSLSDGQSFLLPVQPSHIKDFAGRRLAFTMSKNNDLRWIAEWARYHAKMHGTDAIVFFDNGSTLYETAEIEAVIAAQGIAKAAVHSWPYLYGAPDPAIRLNPFYTQFLQVGSMSVALRRYGMECAGVLNCDVDELVTTSGKASIYEAVEQSPAGLIVMQGRYIEVVPDRADAPFGDHRDYSHYLADPKLALSRPKKWILDPKRAWVKNLKVHPYMHWIENRPPFAKTRDETIFYRHFRAINTNWKDRRTELAPSPRQDLRIDEAFRQSWRAG